MKKTTTNQDARLEKQDFDLFDALAALDRKDYNYYSKLSEEQQKKFVPYMMLMWMSAVKQNGDISAYHVLSTEEFANRHLFNEHVQNHPELQWLMFCVSSPKMGRQFHEWIPHLSERISKYREPATIKQVQDYFGKVYVGSKASDIKEFSKIYLDEQHKKCRLAKMNDLLKYEDLEVLNLLTTQEEIAEYERELGRD